jgi:hypothetical protein
MAKPTTPTKPTDTPAEHAPKTQPGQGHPNAADKPFQHERTGGGAARSSHAGPHQGLNTARHRRAQNHPA